MTRWPPGSGVQVWRRWARLHVSIATRVPFSANAHLTGGEWIATKDKRPTRADRAQLRRRLDFGGEITAGAVIARQSG